MNRRNLLTYAHALLLADPRGSARDIFLPLGPIVFNVMHPTGMFSCLNIIRKIKISCNARGRGWI